MLPVAICLLGAGAVWSHTTLYLRFTCRQPSPAWLAPAEYVRLEADWRGVRRAAWRRETTGEASLQAVPDRFAASGQPLCDWDWHRYHGVDDTGWWLELEIPG